MCSYVSDGILTSIGPNINHNYKIRYNIVQKLPVPIPFPSILIITNDRPKRLTYVV
ncbi:hypothetical protein HanRHA438_Chr14g0655391 [Helianthus annuus]|nr:hypothetical protein HanRHA438_Chr14g0655391 [Helianthus annuus]